MSHTACVSMSNEQRNLTMTSELASMPRPAMKKREPKAKVKIQIGWLAQGIVIRVRSTRTFGEGALPISQVAALLVFIRRWDGGKHARLLNGSTKRRDTRWSSL